MKIYNKTQKITSQDVQKILENELVSTVADLNTIFSSNTSFTNRLAAATDIIAGTDLINYNEEYAREIVNDMFNLDGSRDFQKMEYHYEKDKSWSKTKYRENLQKATGKLATGYDAHHTFPKDKQFEAFFKRIGIDVNDPANLVWRESYEHREKSRLHNHAWRVFIEKNSHLPPEEVRQKAFEQRNKIEMEIWGNSGDQPAR